MRSCEYTKTSGDRRTKTLAVGDFRFFRNKRLVHHDDPNLHNADTITTTFRKQKNEELDDSITQQRNLDPLMCPVKAGAYTVRRIRNLPGSTDATTIDTFLDPPSGKFVLLEASAILKPFWAIAAAMGSDELGFLPSEIGTHSNRAACAMATYLNGAPVYTIMLIGRWSSDAFLLYIRKQVQEFTSGVSSKMINTSSFFTIPEEAHHDDPRTSGNLANIATSANSQIGRAFTNRPIMGPNLHIFN